MIKSILWFPQNMFSIFFFISFFFKFYIINRFIYYLNLINRVFIFVMRPYFLSVRYIVTPLEEENPEKDFLVWCKSSFLMQGRWMAISNILVQVRQHDASTTKDTLSTCQKHNFKLVERLTTWRWPRLRFQIVIFRHLPPIIHKKYDTLHYYILHIIMSVPWYSH